MKQYNKLFAILFAVLGISISAKAQTWTPSNVSAGTYYLYNVGAKKFLCSGNNWGSHASVTEGGIPVTLAGSGNVYTISTAAIYADKFLETEWMDGGAYNWTFEQVRTGVYKLKNGSNVLYWSGGTSTNTTFGADPGTEASQWMLVTEESRIADMANATQQNPIDATFLIKNAYLAKGNGHYFVRNGNYNSLSTSTSWKGTDLTDFWGNDVGTEDACYAIEQYGKTFDNYQELTLPNGKYFMTAKGFYRGSVVPYIYANSEKCNLKQKGDIGGDNLTNGAIALRGNDYLLDGVNVIVNNGTLRVGVKSDSNIDWCMFDDFKLVYYGKDLTVYETALNNAITTAQSIDNTKLNAIVANKLNESISNAQSALQDANRTVESLEAQRGLLENAIASANDFIPPYESLQAFFATCESILSNSAEFETGAKASFSTALSTAKTNVEKAETADAINAVYNTLETERQTYVQKADPTNGTSFDYTFKITNPAFDGNNTTGWECESNAQNKGTASNQQNGIITGPYYENWNGSNFTGTIWQEASGFPSGKYLFKAAAFGNGAYVFANDKQTAVTTTEGAWYEVEVAVSEGTLKFGIKNENATDWMGLDNVSLMYYGFDVETAKAGVSSLKAKAEALAGKAMNATVKAALNSAISKANTVNPIRGELNAVIDELGAAIADAEASVAVYETINSYITKANAIDKSIAASYQTQYSNGTFDESDVETVFQELEVATYNYVMANFTYDVALANEWSSTAKNTAAADVKGEHYSGDEEYTYKNQLDDWGSNTQGFPATSWSIEFDQEVTLPAGEYVFKVAGRKSADATLELAVTMGETVLGTVNDFPNGNEGLGINKNGAASFDANDPAGFAKEGKGYGWQWRYVKFTLAQESTVKIAVNAKTEKQWQWVSFGDYTLQMTEDTYLEAAQPTLEAALAPAKALIASLPMGDAEKSALQSAIDMPATTGEELHAKIEALTTSIANANAWVAAYNEAKAPLVAALDRFEADYNEGADGCTRYKKESYWTAVIEKVQTAALAKDVTNSYDGFATATTELVAALDALQKSIDLYAKLKAEISYARSYTPVVTDNTAGHTAAINAAQAAYDAAETDDASELIRAMQNYKVLDAEYVADSYNTEVTLGEWTGDTGTNKGQHWNGDGEATYYDYSRWGGAQTFEATQTITLPAGDYVLKAAGRASEVAGTEAYIKVDATKVNFVAKGGTGYGIDTDGNINFSTDGTYANGNNGYGWEWRFIEFTLTKETEVTLTAGMTIADSHDPLSWAGVCTPVLLKPDMDLAYSNLQTTIDARQPIWDGVETEYESTILPAYQAACTNRTYTYVREIKAAIAEVEAAYAEYIRNTANNTDRMLALTDLIADADCQKSDGWPGSGRSMMTGEHWSGNTERAYFAQNHQNGAARTQTVELPYEGYYLLKVSARTVEANSYADIIVNGESNKAEGAHGRTGGTIATDGTEWESIEAGIAEGKTFANSNKGYGWVYQYVYFETASTDALTTIAINLSDKDTHKAEANVGGMELYFIGKNYTVMKDNIVKHHGEYSETLAATHTTHDVTAAEMSGVTVDFTASPNALIIANEGQVSNASNVIVDGTAAKLSITDGYAFHATSDFTAGALSYNRQFTKDTWLTVCLPFAYAIPENVKVETLSEIDTDTKTFTFDEVTGTMEANKPYIIKNNTAVAALFASLGNTAVVATPEAMSVTVNGSEGEFMGTYTTRSSEELMENGTYDILFFGTDGQLYYLSEGVTTNVITFNPFRAYIRLPKGTINWQDGQKARVRHRAFGEATDIEDSEIRNQESGIIYDLMGRKVTTMERGKMYIVNGKKVIR